MSRFLSILALLASCLPALGQTGNAVKQSGNVTPGHGAIWTTNGIIQDAGTAANGFLSSLGVVGQGQTICQRTAPITAPAYQELCWNISDATGVSLNIQNYGTDTPQPFSIVLNGTAYQFPFTTNGAVGPVSTVIGDVATWNNTVGTLLADTPALSIFGTQTANTVLAGPTTGSAANPTFRALGTTDVPPSFGANALNYGMSTSGTAAANAAGLASACTASPNVYIPAGSYTIQTAALTGCAYIHGDGIGQTLLVAGGSPSHAILYFNGNTDVIVENLEVDNTTSVSTIDGIECLSSTHCVIRNVLAEGNIGIYCSFVTDCLVENSTVDSYGTYGIDTSQGTTAKVQFNTISGPGGLANHGIVCQLQTSCDISYNKSSNALIFNYEATDASNVVIHGNLSVNSIHEAINITYNTGPTPSRIIIDDNIAQFNSSSLDYCISINAAGNSAVKGSIIGNICDSPGKNGIVLVDGAQYWQVSDNTIISPNALNLSGTGAALQIQGSSTNNFMSNNFINDVAGNMTVVGVEFADGSGNPNANIFGPNYGSRGTAATPYSVVGTTTQWIDVADAWVIVASKPTITCSSGTIGTYSNQNMRYKRIGGKTVQFLMTAQAAIGTCSGTIALAGFPFTFSTNGAPIVTGRDATTGSMLQCIVNGGASTIGLTTYNNASPTVTDAFSCSGTAEIN
jgi:hypothetical protein